AQCALVGLACGAAGTVFGAALRGARRIVRSHVGRPVLAAVAGGLLFAGVVLACGWQGFEGTGMPLLRGALAGHAGGADFAVKAGLTVLALGFGLKGGEIMPMFTVGALLGCSLGGLMGASAPFSAALGLAAFFAAASRCPLAALFMGAEIFGLAAAWRSRWRRLRGSRDVGVFGRGAATSSCGCARARGGAPPEGWKRWARCGRLTERGKARRVRPRRRRGRGPRGRPWPPRAGGGAALSARFPSSSPCRFGRGIGMFRLRLRWA
ncbi:MAG: chloride channel protein, partial [Eggerthellaceae bacterium]